MTSFAYPPLMAANHFDPFSPGDAYSNFPTTSQSYPAQTSSSWDSPFPPALTSIDSFPAVHAFSEAPRSQDSYAYGLEAPIQDFKAQQASHRPYSPAASPAENMAPPRLSSSSTSGASVHSTSSSTMGSPHLHPQFITQEHDWRTMMPPHGLGLVPEPSQEPFGNEVFFTTSIDQAAINTTIANDKLSGFVDPNMINPHAFPSPVPYTHYPELPQPSPQFLEHPPSPAPSNASQHGRVKTSPSQSPFLRSNQYHPYAMPPNRRLSTSSMHSARSSQRSTSFELDEEARERGLCPIPDCGRVVKDLKAHMLTHQEERPEKCPIQTCEYHTKGFARKYDKNRHTLTHYKGTMVCGFCPGSGSAAEKSFNRADVFKRHLTSVHGVEQAPPNSRKKSPSNKKGFSAGQNTAAGTCSTCNVTFANAQDFYEHLDDCVLRVVQQIDPSEEINEKHLTAISETREVQDTLERNGLHNTTDYTAPPYDENDDEDDEDEEVDNDDANDTTYGSRTSRSGKGVIKSKSKGSS